MPKIHRIQVAQSLDTGPQIAAVAIRYEGKIYSAPPPARHNSVIRQIHDQTGAINIQGEEGFLTDDGRFVNRNEAAKIAQATGQAASLGSSELYSEDLW